MLDCNQKVGSRVCANSKRKGDVIRLRNSNSAKEPYLIEIETGCKSETRRGMRFCEECLSEFGIRDKMTGDVLFLESLHPLGIYASGQARSPGEEYILVKQFGVRYKF